MKYVFDRMENIVGKDESTAIKHFLLLPPSLQKAFLSELLEVVIVSQSVNPFPHDKF